MSARLHAPAPASLSGSARRLTRNLAANVVGRLANLAAVYLFVPLYLRLLGLEAYGVVGFFTVLQGALAFVDAGLTAALSRESARLNADPAGHAELRDVVHTMERAYGAAWLVVGTVVWAAAPLIAGRMLHAETLAHETLVAAVRAMGVAVPLQFFAGFYQGGLLGLERQVSANLLQIGWTVARSAGAALVLWALGPTLDAFFAVQIAAALAYVAATRAALHAALPPAARGGRWARPVLARVRGYMSGMMLLSVASAVLVQADKLVVGRTLPLAAFGAYTLASSLAQMPLVFAWPVASAVFPRLTALAAREDRAGLARTYHTACQLVAVATAPAALCVGLFGRELALAWTRSPATASLLAPPLLLLSLGSLCLALQVVPYNLALAHAWTRLNLVLAAASVVILVPLLVLLVRRYGAVGGGAAWLALNAGSLPPFTYLLHRRLLPGATRRWWLEDTLRPVLCAAIPAVAVRLFVHLNGRPSAMLVPLLAGVLAQAAAIAAAPATYPVLARLRGRWPLTPVRA